MLPSIRKWRNFLHWQLVRWLQRALPLVLAALGLRFPRHVALIMDGNRRFARRDNMAVGYGHRKGFDRLMQIVKWCTFTGVREVTVYAFSIENFKRDQEEVASLMQLAEKKFHEIMQSDAEIRPWGVRVRIVGRWELLPAAVRSIAARVCTATARYHTLTLNMAVPYTGRDELSRAASALVTGVQRGEIPAEAVTEGLISRALEISTPDLLVRTSGEVRLSDFLLWQASDTALYFTDVLWPDFGVHHLLKAVLYYWRHGPKKPEPPLPSDSEKTFLKNLEKARWKQIEIMAGA